MCNAWNHSSDCRCGWGGEDHAGRRVGSFTFSSSFAQPVHPTFRSLDSYTRPNSRCPVCRASVFFYQSPNGGKVYFDELGGDWPKHPCTSYSTSRKSPSFSHLHLNANAKPLSFSRLATPLIVSRIENHQFAGYTRVFAELNGKTLVLWTSCLDLQEGAPFSVLNKLITFSRLKQFQFQKKTFLHLSFSKPTFVRWTSKLRARKFDQLNVQRA